MKREIVLTESEYDVIVDCVESLSDSIDCDKNDESKEWRLNKLNKIQDVLYGNL